MDADSDQSPERSVVDVDVIGAVGTLKTFQNLTLSQTR